MPGAPGVGAEEAAMTRKEAAAVATAPRRAERESGMVVPFERADHWSDADDSSLSRSGMYMTLPSCHVLLAG
ncbi:hypothetical protein GCM10018980_23740 [Streptomyces capoamus]|uniref:Uncharacterized protein n=1 Tax=Streptomyces capoamus TaxID=68183 RepID=A0A919EWP4_9ACTN|nr:hypothetical protein GCM10010501_58500 [Streptomyces libani subsp. rufus]GHG45414.1 hypothetical protein GCM10018980_23740 [Streptomyces capoamus]